MSSHNVNSAESIGTSVASVDSSNLASNPHNVQLLPSKCNKRVELIELDKNAEINNNNNLNHANNSTQGDNSIQSEQICLHNSVIVITPDAVEVNNSNLKNGCSQPKLDIKNSESIRTTIDSTTDIVDDSTSDSDGFIGVNVGVRM